MDPLSIAATIVSLVETALKIKASVDKVSQVRERAKELAQDVLDILVSLAQFYEANKESLLNDTTVGAVDLALDGLKRDLLRILRRCQHIENHSFGWGRLKKLTRGFHAWINSDALESELLRMRETIQLSLLRVNLLISAGNAITTLRMEQALLVQPSTSRCQLKQIDRVFAQGMQDELLTGCRFLFPLASQPICDVDVQYIRSKAGNIITLLQESPSSLAIHPSYTASDDELGYNYIAIPDVPCELRLSTILLHLTESWDTLSTGRWDFGVRNPMDDMLDLASSLLNFGCSDLAQSLYDTIDDIIRGNLNSPDTSHSHKSALHTRLQHTLQGKTRAKASLLGSGDLPDPSCEAEILGYSKEASKICRARLEYSQSARSSFLQRLELVLALQDTLYFDYLHGRFDQCVSTCMDTLDILHASFRTYQDDILCYAYGMQVYALTLFKLASAQELSGDYTRAYYVGRDCIATIQTLSHLPFEAPRCFNFFAQEQSTLEKGFCSLVSIVRGPNLARTDETDEVVYSGEAL
ncbi:hypothetical protein ONZ45_g9742 [Pleurotus djamor]|nr:hypothetical protein ONZ45_g9742 [Pleurotus djamor]